MGRWVSVSAKSIKEAQQVVDDIFGKGKYTVSACRASLIDLADTLTHLPIASLNLNYRGKVLSVADAGPLTKSAPSDNSELTCVDKSVISVGLFNI